MKVVKILFYLFVFLSIVILYPMQVYAVKGTQGLVELVGLEVPHKIKIKEVQKVVEVEKPKVTFDEALAERMAQSKVSRWLVDCVLNRESSGSKRMSLTRFEQSYMERAKRITRNPDEQRLWASSWCPFQIMAPWVREFGLDDWSDLLDVETCVDVGMKILERCWKDAKGHGRTKIYNTGICYNGQTGQAYATALVECVSSAAINKIMEGDNAN